MRPSHDQREAAVYDFHRLHGEEMCKQSTAQTATDAVRYGWDQAVAAVVAATLQSASADREAWRMSLTLADAVRSQQNRAFQDFTTTLVELFKSHGNGWDTALDAWAHEVRTSVYLEERDRSLLFDLQQQLFN
jgi:hypothetical protein